MVGTSQAPMYLYLESIRGEQKDPRKYSGNTRNDEENNPGLLLYDDIYPSELRGRGPGGSQVTLPVCPEFGAEVISDFDQNSVSLIHNYS